MKLEFYGVYKNHITKKTKNDKDYTELNCLEQMSNKNVKILVFNNEIVKNLEMFKEGDGIVVIFSTWYDYETKNNVLFVKDITCVDG